MKDEVSDLWREEEQKSVCIIYNININPIVRTYPSIMLFATSLPGGFCTSLAMDMPISDIWDAIKAWLRSKGSSGTRVS